VSVAASIGRYVADASWLARLGRKCERANAPTSGAIRVDDDPVRVALGFVGLYWL
jgi:hypothetical protein